MKKPLLLYFSLACFLNGFLGACASVSLQREGPEVRIVGTAVGASIELSPPVLRIQPGQKVFWTNHTTYDLQINFDPDSSDSNRPSFIPKLSSVPGKFEQPGTYSYTLIFSASKTFGRVTGTIVVGDGDKKIEPFDDPKDQDPTDPRDPQDKEFKRRPNPLPEEDPGTEPFII